MELSKVLCTKRCTNNHRSWTRIREFIHRHMAISAGKKSCSLIPTTKDEQEEKELCAPPPTPTMSPKTGTSMASTTTTKSQDHFARCTARLITWLRRAYVGVEEKQKDTALDREIPGLEAYLRNFYMEERVDYPSGMGIDGSSAGRR
ncbi:uncharacterized protein BP5553_01793 [Venustampulla echinocandica]|uniref:Uncharacterized protein n=1 Tax=Venustampulla echinocandica TaxID=2656787 RepID=A0A370U210_9HELO|nr:uncharacterized protein BP5553_01793 [Venustampulla echinocandica]RDL41814.1 hypothetical protein BP5553_01793 [Venustampulla echinocandica]